MRGVAVKRLFSALWVISLLVPAVASAQPFPVNAAGVTNGHWHMNSKDIEANKKIFVAMGGTLVNAGNFQIVRFPGVLVYCMNEGTLIETVTMSPESTSLAPAENENERWPLPRSTRMLGKGSPVKLGAWLGIASVPPGTAAA